MKLEKKAKLIDSLGQKKTAFKYENGFKFHR